MLITLNIQGATPEEIREACKQFAELGTSSRVVITPEDLGQEALPPLPKSGTRRYKQTYTKQENETIVALYNKGYSWDEIADYLGRKTGNSIRTQFCTYRKEQERLKAKED